MSVTNLPNPRGRKRKLPKEPAKPKTEIEEQAEAFNEAVTKLVQLRLKSQELLTNALTRKDTTQDAVQHTEYEVDPATMGRQIEGALFARHKKIISTAYDEQLFTLAFNLQKANNSGLRNALLRGEITPAELVEMRVQDLANPELINSRDADAEWAKKIAMVKSLNPSKPTDAYTCHKCHQKECTTVRLQIRSADEAMTTFVSCMNCGNMWRD